MNEQFLEYMNSFFSYDSEILSEIDKTSVGRKDIQPQVEKEIGKLISLLIKATKAKRVLELGTCIGYSTIWIATALSLTNGHLTTVDNHIITSKEARANINRADLTKYVDFVIGNAQDVVKELNSEFDIVFQDCSKALYCDMHEDCVRLVKKGGLIITDDTMFKVKDDVRKRLGDYTDEYNKLLFSDSRLYSIMLPLGGGLTISLKK